MDTPGADGTSSRSGGALSAAARLVPGVPHRLLEAVPRARVALLPPGARLPFDIGPLPAAVTLVAAEIAAIAIGVRALLVREAGAGARGGPVASKILIVR